MNAITHGTHVAGISNHLETPSGGSAAFTFSLFASSNTQQPHDHIGSGANETHHDDAEDENADEQTLLESLDGISVVSSSDSVGDMDEPDFVLQDKVDAALASNQDDLAPMSSSDDIPDLIDEGFHEGQPQDVVAPSLQVEPSFSSKTVVVSEETQSSTVLVDGPVADQEATVAAISQVDTAPEATLRTAHDVPSSQVEAPSNAADDAATPESNDEQPPLVPDDSPRSPQQSIGESNTNQDGPISQEATLGPADDEEEAFQDVDDSLEPSEESFRQSTHEGDTPLKIQGETPVTPPQSIENAMRSSKEGEEKKEDSASDAPEASFREAKDNAFDLFREYQYSDPLMRLNEWYQKKGVLSMGDSFTIDTNTDKKGPKFWRCHFTCPITKEVYHSSLPLPLLLGGREPANDDLAVVTTKFFDRYRIMDGLVYFTNKTGAKKSAALAALEGLGALTISFDNRIMVGSVAEASAQLLQSPTSSVVQEPKAFPKTKHFPSWVHELYELGVRPESFTISYHERFDESSNQAVWSFSPIAFCCVMTIETPLRLSVVGAPHANKKEARQSAARLLVEEAKRQLAEKKVSPWKSPNRLSFPSHAAQKQQLLACDVQMASYVCPLPPWAGASFQMEDEKKPEPACQVYLYELIVRSNAGKLLMSEKLGIPDSYTTRLGIVFPADIQPPHGMMEIDGPSSFEAVFSAPNKIDGSATATLTRRTLIDLAALDKGTPAEGLDVRLQWMKTFQLKVFKRSEYGFTGATKGIRKSSGDNLGSGSNVQAGVGRTYLFVPLCGESTEPTETVAKERALTIDWQMIEDVAKGRTLPFLKIPSREVKLPLLGPMDCAVISCACALIALTMFFPEILVGRDGNILERMQHVSGWEKAVAIVMLLSSVGVMAGTISACPQQRMKTEELVNRLLLLEPRNFLYKFASDAKPEDRQKTAKSQMLTEKERSELPRVASDKWRYNKDMYGLDVEKATFAEYFWKRYGKKIHHANCLLIPAYSLRKYRDHCPFYTKSGLDYLFLVPEFLRVLPMPRDVLYIGDLVEYLMPQLERAIQLDWVCHSLEQASKKVQFGINNATSLRSVPVPSDRIQETRLAPLLKDATTISPFVLYERMEFLGDAVLGFFLALNIFARNADLAWDCDDCGDIHSFAGKNVTLFNAALSVGIPRLVEAGGRPWKSAYVPTVPTAKQSIGFMLALGPPGATAKIADSTIGDVVEAVLAAAYLFGRSRNDDETAGRLVVAILEKLCLPMPEMTDADHREWFRARGPCLTGGYPFEFDSQWQQQLVKLGTTLYLENAVIDKLEAGWEKLIGILLGNQANDEMRKALEHQRSKILLLCALFDDSLNSDEKISEGTPHRMNSSFSNSNTNSSFGDEEPSQNGSAMTGLFQLALVRDSLFCIGAFALQLALTQEVVRRYPDATPGDLHILRGCALADDVVVYIMMKAGVHKTLFDDTAPAVNKLRTRILFADELGEKLWQERGGWTVGGKDEFRRRYAAFGYCAGDEHPSPKYPGIGGGRLHGTKAKLPEGLTGDLVFSFKAVIGALVLSLGLDAMWLHLGPMFIEALLLTADELRSEYGDVTGLCAGKRGKGEKKRNKKQLKYGVLD